MQAIINSIVARCVAKGYILEQQAPWLKYGIEKRLVGFIVTIPFLIFGFLISNIPLTMAYYIGFRYLRSRTNGLHANSVIGCLLASIFCEFVFLGLVFPALDSRTILLLLPIATIIIFFLAPYTHPNMELSEEEIAMCAKSSKIRLGILLVVCFITTIFKFNYIANGIALSIVTTAVMLVLAYILKERRQS